MVGRAGKFMCSLCKGLGCRSGKFVCSVCVTIRILDLICLCVCTVFVTIGTVDCTTYQDTLGLIYSCFLCVMIGDGTVYPNGADLICVFFM